MSEPVVPSPAPPRKRLSTALVAVCATLGVLWTGLSIALLIAGTGYSGALRVANVTTNLTGGLLLCATAWLGTRPRPTTALSGRALAAAVTICSIPAAAAIVEGVLGRRAEVTTSAPFDVLVSIAAGVAAVGVIRSRAADS